MRISKLNLVFSGSGVRFIAQLWAYIKIQRLLKFKTENINALVATSGGTIPATWIALGREPGELWKIIKNTDMQELESQFLFSIRMVLLFSIGLPLLSLLLLLLFGETLEQRIFFFLFIVIPPSLIFLWFRRRFGIFSTKAIQRQLELLFKEKTFQDLMIPLHIVAWDLNKGEVMLFNKQRTPNLSLAEACGMSMNVPGVFPIIRKSFFRKERWIVDGGIGGHSYFIDFFTDRSIPLIGIKVKSPRKGLQKLSIKDFIIAVLNTIQDAFEREHMEDADWAHTFQIITDIPFLDFNLTLQRKEQLKQDGLRAVDRKRLIKICEACVKE